MINHIFSIYLLRYTDHSKNLWSSFDPLIQRSFHDLFIQKPPIWVATVTTMTSGSAQLHRRTRAPGMDVLIQWELMASNGIYRGISPSSKLVAGLDLFCYFLGIILPTGENIFQRGSHHQPVWLVIRIVQAHIYLECASIKPVVSVPQKSHIIPQSSWGIP